MTAGLSVQPKALHGNSQSSNVQRKLMQNFSTTRSEFMWAGSRQSRPCFLQMTQVNINHTFSYNCSQSLKVDEDPASLSMVSHISKWTSICTVGYKTFRRELLGMMPRRVIDVGPLDGSEHPRLTTTDNIHDNYITFSYRWGTAFPLTTTLKTLKAHSEGIQFDSFPKTLRDAILVTRKMVI
jgi:hypothetical protein